jgi:hypothetical protein
MAELAAITTTLDLYKLGPTLSILTDSAFSINNLRNYISDPHKFIHHQHKDLVILANNITHTRDKLEYTTHIGRVKSHTGVTHNDEADAGGRGDVEGTKTLGITFTAVDPPIGRLRTWPHTCTHHPDNTPIITKIADLHNGLRKIIKNKPHTNNTSTNTADTHILQNARSLGSDYSIHLYSRSSYRARGDALEVMSWFTSTDANGNMTLPSLVPNANPR